MKRRWIGRKLKRVVVLTLVFVLSLGVLTPSASADWRATPSVNPFTDVLPHNWHHDNVSWAWVNGITTGTSPSTFGPDNNVTRAQFATFIHRVAGTPPASPSAFADSDRIPGWAASAVCWASSTGVTTGFLNDNTYRPSIDITREQIAAMLYRYAEHIGADTTAPEDALSTFPDRRQVSGWATTAMRWAVHYRIITGINGNIAPQNNATRAQSVAMLNRFVNTFGISAVDLPPIPDVPAQAFISHLYREALGRTPDLNSLIRWSLDISRGVPGAALAYSLIFSPEMDGRNLSNGEFADMLYMSLFNRSSTAQERETLENELYSGASRFSIYAGFIRSAEFAEFCGTFNIAPGNAVDPSGRMIALTFDDGPTDVTNRVLDVLARHNAAATFYITGSLAAEDRATVLRTFNLRSEIGNHGWTHEDLTTVPRQTVRNEITRTSNLIQSITGIRPATYRPTYGRYNSNVIDIATEQGLPIINWTLNSEWDGVYPGAMATRVINNAGSGDIVLLHDKLSFVVADTNRIIIDLTRRGFQFVTVSEILFYSNIRLSPGQSYGGAGE